MDCRGCFGASFNDCRFCWRISNKKHQEESIKDKKQMNARQRFTKLTTKKDIEY